MSDLTGRRGRRPADVSPSVRWPLPPPGRVRWAWLLGLRVRRWQLRRMLRRAVPHLGARSRVLDLGAGTGADVEELDRLIAVGGGSRRVLVDAQRAMLVKARSGAAGRRSEVVQADAARLPFRDGIADVVLSIGLLCCVDEAAVPSAIVESTRVLAPSGVLVLAVPRWRGAPDEAATAATGLVRRDGGRPGHAVFQKQV